MVSRVAGSQCLRHEPLSLTRSKLHEIKLLAGTPSNPNVPMASFAMNKDCIRCSWYRHDVSLLVEIGQEHIKRTISQHKYAENRLDHFAQLYTLRQYVLSSAFPLTLLHCLLFTSTLDQARILKRSRHHRQLPGPFFHHG